MTNAVTPPGGLGIGSPSPAAQAEPSANGFAFEHTGYFDLPGGQERLVRVRIGAEQEPGAEERHAELLRKLDTYGHTGPLEREVAQLTARFQEITGYDKQGQPVYLVQGRARELLEMKLVNRTRALHGARDLVKEATAFQEAERRAHTEKTQRIYAAAERRAAEMAEEAEVQRQAELIAARKHGIRPAKG